MDRRRPHLLPKQTSAVSVAESTGTLLRFSPSSVPEESRDDNSVSVGRPFPEHVSNSLASLQETIDSAITNVIRPMSISVATLSNTVAANHGQRLSLPEDQMWDQGDSVLLGDGPNDKSFILVPDYDPTFDDVLFTVYTVYRKSDVLVTTTVAPDTLVGIKYVLTVTGNAATRGTRVGGTAIVYKSDTPFLVTLVKRYGSTYRIDLTELNPNLPNELALARQRPTPLRSTTMTTAVTNDSSFATQKK